MAAQYRIDCTGTVIHRHSPRRLREEKYNELVRKRKLIRKAFDKVRYDPNRSRSMALVLRALTGPPEGITEEILLKARNILEQGARSSAD